MRGLKHFVIMRSRAAIAVAPSRVRGLKRLPPALRQLGPRRTLTGAWIETLSKSPPLRGLKVAPSRVRGLKP